MADLTPEISADVLAACQAGAGEAAEALSRALDAQLQLEVGEATTWDASQPPEGFEGPGLAVVLHCGSTAALVLLAETSGLLPEWYAAPDPTGRSKLDTLAQELGMLLLPESHMAEQFEAGRVEDVQQALAAAGLSEQAGWIPLKLTAGDRSATAHLVWPASSPANLFSAPASEAETEAEPSPAAESAPPPEDEPTGQQAAPKGSGSDAPQPPQPASGGHSLDELPAYIRSLLRVRVPVTATLAAKKETLGKILEISPGAILQFDKSCEELLDLEIGGQRCAQGEAVKVGDKFGLRITSIVLPSERFAPIRAARAEQLKQAGKKAG